MGGLCERATISAVITCSILEVERRAVLTAHEGPSLLQPPKPLLGGELAQRQNCEGTQKKREVIPRVCITCQINVDGREEEDLA